MLLPILRLTLILAIALLTTPLLAVDYEKPPINYSESLGNNIITRLQARLDAGEAKLEADGASGYLRSLLRELKIPVSSQMLAFAKHSQQRNIITPKNPRAMYFNDHAYVGWVPGGIIEIAVSDPQLGGMFYTLDPEVGSPPKFTREANRCMTCHGTNRTLHVPGFQVRSVFVDPNAQPIIAAGSFRTNHTSPLAQRWGGWYVTGTHGEQKHLGNLILPDSKKPKSIDNAAGQNVTDLASRLDLAPYLAPSSDIVALMVFEHQADAHNLITRLGMEIRLAEYAENQQPAATDDERAKLRAETDQRIATEGEALVRYLLFSGESKLTAPITGTSSFVKDFAASGPRDSQGRSLRDFDLQTRLFKHPLSFTMYSESFTALPPRAKAVVFRRLREILTRQDSTEPFTHLSADDRQAILKIVRATMSEGLTTADSKE
ncbi:MAG: hypothetical protein IAG10_28775 [Planctomycetaceae bacterium]|nr:hypothetical protein [Planctomycetaceae bacterium]